MTKRGKLVPTTLHTIDKEEEEEKEEREKWISLF